jgi:hypothetical protein
VREDVRALHRPLQAQRRRQRLRHLLGLGRRGRKRRVLDTTSHPAMWGRQPLRCALRRLSELVPCSRPYERCVSVPHRSSKPAVWCEQACGPDADRRTTPLISRKAEGSSTGAH